MPLTGLDPTSIPSNQENLASLSGPTRHCRPVTPNPPPNPLSQHNTFSLRLRVKTETTCRPKLRLRRRDYQRCALLSLVVPLSYLGSYVARYVLSAMPIMSRFSALKRLPRVKVFLPRRLLKKSSLQGHQEPARPRNFVLGHGRCDFLAAASQLSHQIAAILMMTTLVSVTANTTTARNNGPIPRQLHILSLAWSIG